MKNNNKKIIKKNKITEIFIYSLKNYCSTAAVSSSATSATATFDSSAASCCTSR
jgi:hypothetical protein